MLSIESPMKASMLSCHWWSWFGWVAVSMPSTRTCSITQVISGHLVSTITLIMQQWGGQLQRMELVARCGSRQKIVHNRQTFWWSQTPGRSRHAHLSGCLAWQATHGADNVKLMNPVAIRAFADGPVAALLEVAAHTSFWGLDVN